jgi:hypothetical protein
MAANRINCNHQEETNRRLIRGLQMIREGKQNVEIALASYSAMKDGDGTQAAHFDQMVSICGITQGDYVDANTAAKKLFDECNSVGGNVNVAPAEQLAAYLGV